MRKTKSEVVWEHDLDDESKTGWLQVGGMLSGGVNGKTRRYPKVTDEPCYMSSGFLQEECEDEHNRTER